MFGTLYLQQADHPLFVCPNGNLLKFKQWSVALYRGNTNKGTFRGLHFAPKYRFKCKCLLNKSSNEMLIDKSPLGPAPASRFFRIPELFKECFHMTSRRPYWCPKTMKRRPCWCPMWELNSFLMQTLSFVPIHLHRCCPREWKHAKALLCEIINGEYF